MKKQNTDKRAAVGYVRVSTAEQTESGLSLEWQEKQVRAYAETRGLELVEIVTDAGVSAGTPLAKRPGGGRVLTLAKRRDVSAVLVAKQDRAFRRAGEAIDTAEAWERRGVELHLLDKGGAVDVATATGGLEYGIRALFSQYERKLISERTAAALERKRERGEKTGGGIPYGYRVERGRILPDENEQRITKRIERLRAKGYTLRKVADRLNRDGLQTKRGAAWKAVQVARALRNAERFAVAV